MEKLGFPDDVMLTIDQISYLAKVSKSALRYWEKIFGDFLKPARTQTNRREYTMEDLYQVLTIKQLLEEQHLTANGVRLRLRKILATESEKEARGQAKFKTAKGRPAPSIVRANPSVK